MAELLSQLQDRADKDWLVGGDSCTLANLATQQAHVLTSQSARSQWVLLVESEPLAFLAGFVAAVATGQTVCLGNPGWGRQEWQQVFAAVQPDCILGHRPDLQYVEPSHSPPQLPTHPAILIPTGGSSGRLRFAVHTWDTLMASVTGFRQYFRRDRIDSYCVLPLYHVSGLMQFLRSFTSGGRLALQSFKALETGNPLPLDPAQSFISLVPTQLQRLLTQTTQRSWLAQFSTVLLGGAPPWPSLLEQAHQAGIRLAPTYGMTETASQVATLLPKDFLNGRHNTCGPALPHARITIRDAAGKPLGPDRIGSIGIRAKSLALGYWPPTEPAESTFLGSPPELQTDDLGFWDAAGYLHVIGRGSDKIVTGGENVFPTEVEAALRATQLVADVCVVGIPSVEWGQAVAAIYVPAQTNLDAIALKQALQDRLSRFKHPKHWIAVERLPRNTQGKVLRSQVLQLARQAIETKHED